MLLIWTRSVRFAIYFRVVKVKMVILMERVMKLKG